jgi:ribose transport system substrate-binding protein
VHGDRRHGNVVELQGTAGTAAARDRGQGFNDYLKTSCPGVKIVARQTADFNRIKGVCVFDSILQAQPDIVGVFAHDDEMGLGAIQAAETAKRTGITFVGFGAFDEAKNAIKYGRGRLAATVAQDPVRVGRMAVNTAVMYLNGDLVEKTIPVAPYLIKK